MTPGVQSYAVEPSRRTLPARETQPDPEFAKELENQDRSC